MDARVSVFLVVTVRRRVLWGDGCVVPPAIFGDGFPAVCRLGVLASGGALRSSPAHEVFIGVDSVSLSGSGAECVECTDRWPS